MQQIVHDSGGTTSSTPPTEVPSAALTNAPSATPSISTAITSLLCEMLGDVYCNSTYALCTGSSSHMLEITSCSSNGDVLGLQLTGLTDISSFLAELTSLEQISISDSVLTSDVFSLLLALPNLKTVSLVSCQLTGVIPYACNMFIHLNLANNPGLVGGGERRPLTASNTVSISETFCDGNLEYFNVSGDTGLGCYPPCLLTAIAVVDVSGLSECNTPVIPAASNSSGVPTVSNNLELSSVDRLIEE